MTYPRVNLLKKSEQRYQGAVSRSFILLCGIGAPILIVGLVLGISLANNASIKAQLVSSQALWENLEPRLKEYRVENQGLATGGRVLDLFDGWKQSQVSFVDMLNDVQGAVPGSIQFSRLSIRSEATKPIYKTAAELQLHYSLSIDGIAFGAEAEKQVLIMQKDLLECEQIGAEFDSVKLASMRNRQSKDGESARDFRLVATTQKGEVK